MRLHPAALPAFILCASGCIAPQSSTAHGPAAAAASLTERNNLLGNAHFAGGGYLPWSVSFTEPGRGQGAVTDGAFCLTVANPGKNRWDAQIRHREMVVQRGHTYTVQFKAWASHAMKVRPKVGMAGPPYAEYWNDTIELGTSPQIYNAEFSMREPDDPTAEFAFHVGGELAPVDGPYTICLDEVYLLDPEFRRPDADVMMARPAVRVNQVGYLPGLRKLATVVSAATEPLAFEVIDASGKAVLSGQSRVAGLDAASGEHVHTVDFSTLTTPGSGYRVRVGDDLSHPFDVDAGLYAPIARDALAYFYHNRSGIPIEMPYAGHARWTRPAGHLSDKSVGCAPGSGCSYRLDVSKGWYDAGDHGKYVVNGGIAVWTLMNLYERSRAFGDAAAFADGKLAIPEQGNGVPDLLDEARWQLEFMLGMQVPSGKLAGMVHHKMHDERWTALPLAPHQDEMKRYLQPPSTAATLNLAAVAAQAARLWRKLDPAFSKRALSAAERAFAAAERFPKLLAPKGGVGGGPYDDADVSDELYWAAAELFITTGDETYRKRLESSPYHRGVDSVLRESSAEAGVGSSMTWQVTDALGAISLAVVDNKLPDAQRKAIRKSLVEAADAYLETLEHQGYRVPLAPLGRGELPWGSNSFVLNNMLVLALAHDFTGERRYLDGVHAGMGYLLGRNPLDQSYVTGYGERPLRNPHHRFWAHSIDDAYPPPPPGAISGGPNSGLQDPYVQAAGLAGCAPATCFIDHIEAWSVNEITINWNAPFAWVSAFLDEKGRRKAP